MAYYMHWDYETLIHMEHRERQKWCEETGKINKKISGETTKNFFDV